MTVPICELLRGQLGYSVIPMNPPPAEKKLNALALSITDGCSHNACTFCTMYRNGSYHEKSIEEFRDHVDRVGDWYAANRATVGTPNRIFLGAGNALAVETEKLVEATQYAMIRLKADSGEVPRRLAMYGNAQDVLEHGDRGMKKLRCGGVCFACSIDTLGTRRGLEVLYLGLESGNNNVLRLAGKGYTKDQAIAAVETLRYAKVRASIMVMPGLGGVEHSEGHVADTADVLNMANPEWITFIGLKIWPGTPYRKMMERAESRSANRRLNNLEIVEQTAQIIERLDVRTTVGLHGGDVHTFGENPIALGAHQIYDNYDARVLADQLREAAGLNV